jgi:hypothetical protein
VVRLVSTLTHQGKVESPVNSSGQLSRTQEHPQVQQEPHSVLTSHNKPVPTTPYSPGGGTIAPLTCQNKQVERTVGDLSDSPPANYDRCCQQMIVHRDAIKLRGLDFWLELRGYMTDRQRLADNRVKVRPPSVVLSLRYEQHRNGNPVLPCFHRGMGSTTSRAPD